VLGLRVEQTVDVTDPRRPDTSDRAARRALARPVAQDRIATRAEVLAGRAVLQALAAHHELRELHVDLDGVVYARAGWPGFASLWRFGLAGRPGPRGLGRRPARCRRSREPRRGGATVNPVRVVGPPALEEARRHPAAQDAGRHDQPPAGHRRELGERLDGAAAPGLGRRPRAAPTAMSIHVPVRRPTH
jgi:hypothetical protein